MVIEELKEAEDIRQENEDIKIRYPGSYPIKVCRLSYYTKEFKTKRGLANVKQEEFLGYAIIKEDYITGLGKRIRIYESVIKPSGSENDFIRGVNEWVCSVGDNRFEIKGYLYAQQNNITNVCAHVALRTAAARFCTTGDMTYREMNKMIGVDHINRKVGGTDGTGLNTVEMREILESTGAKCEVIDYTDVQEHRYQDPFQKFLYGSIESGFPAIVVFETADRPDVCHAIPVFGHTFNEDTWVHRAESSYFKVGPGTLYIPSESWVSMYIAHDDNWGSNFCIPRRYLRTRRYCKKLADKCSMDQGCVQYVIATLPKEVQMNAVQAEVIGADYLFTILPQLPDVDEVWRKRLREYARNNQLILRPILLKGKDYSEHLRKVRDWERRRTFKIKVEPESWLWMVELSVPELFPANRRKVGEVILLAEKQPQHYRDFKNFLFARVPGFFAFYLRGQAPTPIYEFVPCALRSHVELYGCEEND